MLERMRDTGKRERERGRMLVKEKSESGRVESEIGKRGKGKDINKIAKGIEKPNGMKVMKLRRDEI